MDNKNINSYQGVVMKEMTLDRMEMVAGGFLKSFLCGAAFAQLSFWNGLALGLAEVSLGATLAVAGGIDLAGAIVCAM